MEWRWGSVYASRIQRATITGTGVGSLEKVFLEPVARFVVDVPRYTVEGLVKLGFLRPDQRDDLFAVIAALKRLGRMPSVSRIA